MLGRKTSTLPTPPMIPSTTRSFSQPSFIVEATNAPTCSTSHSIHCIGYSPKRKVDWNTTYRRKKKIGNASHLLVITASSLSVNVFLRFFPLYGSYVSANAPCTKAYFASTRADSRPDFRRLSILLCSSKRAAMISSLFGSASTTLSISLSFSRYLIAR